MDVETRLQALEDERAVARIIASYGPLVDSGQAEAVAALWTEDGDYVVEGYAEMHSAAEIREMVQSPQHQGLLAGGVAHIQGTPHITVTGDTAHAFCYSVLIVHREGRFYPALVGANRWEFVRTDAGWRVRDRLVRQLDGAEAARALISLG